MPPHKGHHPHKDQVWRRERSCWDHLGLQRVQRGGRRGRKELRPPPGAARGRAQRAASAVPCCFHPLPVCSLAAWNVAFSPISGWSFGRRLLLFQFRRSHYIFHYLKERGEGGERKKERKKNHQTQKRESCFPSRIPAHGSAQHNLCSLPAPGRAWGHPWVLHPAGWGAEQHRRPPDKSGSVPHPLHPHPPNNSALLTPKPLLCSKAPPPRLPVPLHQWMQPAHPPKPRRPPVGLAVCSLLRRPRTAPCCSGGPQLLSASHHSDAFCIGKGWGEGGGCYFGSPGVGRGCGAGAAGCEGTKGSREGLAAAPSPALTPGGIPAHGNAGLGRTPSTDLPCPALYDGGGEAPSVSPQPPPDPQSREELGSGAGNGAAQVVRRSIQEPPQPPARRRTFVPQPSGSDLLMESPRAAKHLFFLLPFFIPFRQKSQRERFPSAPRPSRADGGEQTHPLALRPQPTAAAPISPPSG